MLLHAVYDFPRSLTIPPYIMVLKILLGHTFRCKPLLCEAVTRPSHLSIPSTSPYQRLEYLGDALHDNRFSHDDPSKIALQPHYMHTLRATAVIASFLAFCSLSRTVSTPDARIAPRDPNEAPFTCSRREAHVSTQSPSTCAKPDPRIRPQC